MQTHSLRVFVANLKLDAIYAFFPKIFVTKILLSGKFLFFSDSDQKDKKQNWFQSQGKLSTADQSLLFLKWASILFQKMILIPLSSKININRFSKLNFTPFFLTNQSHLSKYTSSQNLFYSPPPLQLRSLPVNLDFVLCCFNWTHCIGNLKPWRGHNFPVHHFWGTFFFSWDTSQYLEVTVVDFAIFIFIAEIIAMPVLKPFFSFLREIEKKIKWRGGEDASTAPLWLPYASARLYYYRFKSLTRENQGKLGSPPTQHSTAQIQSNAIKGTHCCALPLPKEKNNYTKTQSSM